MKVSEIMSHEVCLLTPEATLLEACEKMRDKDVGFLPVCDGERLQGSVTDRDIVIRGIAAGYNPSSCHVKDIMSHKIVYVYEDQEVEEAAKTMEEKQIRRLVVLNRDKKMVGILSLGDLSTQSNDQKLAGEVLERVSERWEGEKKAS